MLVAQDRGAEAQVLLDRLLHEQAPAFGRKGEAGGNDGESGPAGDVLIAPGDRAAGRGNQTGDGIQRRCFAGAVGAEKCHDGTGWDGQGDVGDTDEVAVSHVQVGDGEHHQSLTRFMWCPR